jgi:hypothetical protein
MSRKAWWRLIDLLKDLDGMDGIHRIGQLIRDTPRRERASIAVKQLCGLRVLVFWP